MLTVFVSSANTLGRERMDGRRKGLLRLEKRIINLL